MVSLCGIAGIVTLNSYPAPSRLEERLSNMAGCMHHRGPDDGGVYLSPDGRMGLANRRLAIRDLSPAGHMPMANADDNLQITYNGEIYNAGELRARLENMGQAFRSRSDTEVILHGYAAWGEAVVQQLRGMFAFAIRDGRSGPGRDKLFVARDRLGIKPLYFARVPGAFLFASELRALRSAGIVSGDISSPGLVGYLMLGAVPNPLTIYKDIQAVEPGCTITVTPATGRVRTARYWSMPRDREEHVGRGAAVDRVRELLEEAVRIRLVSDAPLGAFLSGGIDSSAVVALMRMAHSGSIRTCSMVFEEPGYSEGPYARAMAEAVGAEHCERVITARDLTAEIDNVFRAMDQPTVDGVNTYFASQTARQAGLTVALSGLGGDELFGGYPNTFSGTPQILRALRLASAVPGGTALSASLLGLLPSRRRWAKVIDALGRSPSAASAYVVRRGLFSPSEVRSLVTPDIWQEATQFEPVAHVSQRVGDKFGGTPASLFEWVSRAELSTYTHHQLLRDTDVMSMAHSLEVRVPLLDHKLVEAVLELPAQIKMAGDGPKPLLVAAIGGRLPEIVRDRRDKQGFTLPFDRWLREPLESGHHILNDGRVVCNGMLRAQQAAEVRHAYSAGRLHWSRPWALTVLEGWMLTG